MMISKEQAINAIEYLDTLSAQALTEMRGKLYDHNLSMKNGAYNTLLQFVRENSTHTDVAIVYEYKVRRGDGKLLNKTVWDNKGKTYKNRGAVASAFGQFISAFAESDPKRPRFNYAEYRNHIGDLEYAAKWEQHTKDYNAWYERMKDKNIRAEYIPEDWIVIAIAVNTAQKPIEISAREFYKGAKP